MKLIVITPSRTIQDETDYVTKMFESGLMTLHLRKPRYSTNQMAEYIKEIPEHFHDRIVIHSHHRLAIKFNLKGIHYTSTHLKGGWQYWWIRQRLKLKLGKLVKTRSYRQLAQVYNKEDLHFDYYLTGTMFNSLTGGFYSGYYAESVEAAAKNTGKVIVGRGGANDKSVLLAKQTGLAGLVFNSYIWASESPYQQFLKLVNSYKELGLTIE